MSLSPADSLQLVNHLFNAVIHCRLLDMRALEASSRHLVAELPYRPELVGNPDTGVIAAGAVTTLIDSTCGFAVPLALGRLQICPTLDLRIDHLAAPQPERSIIAEAEVFRITASVVFVRAIAHQGDAQQPIALGTATFMRLQNDAASLEHFLHEANAAHSGPTD